MNSKIEQISTLAIRYALEGRAAGDAIRRIGRSVIDRLPDYLGTRVFGVPPEGDWTLEEYNDDAFSIRRLLTLQPARLGVAVHIPYEIDDFPAGTWVRLAIEFEMIAGDLTVTVADRPRRQFSPDDAQAVDVICEDVFEFLRSIFEAPVKFAVAVEHGKIGFRFE